MTRLQVQEQAADSSGAPPDYEGRIELDPILLDVERLVAALETVRATLLFSSQRAVERLLALTNPCWSLPIGCSWFTEVESKALLPYTPLKVKIWR